MIKPWQENNWQQLLTYHHSQRLPQALLLRGIAGLGKQQLAQYFAQLLLCQKNSLAKVQFSCGTCYACTLCLADSHPDCQLVQPAPDSTMIKIEQIRELHELLTATPHQGAYRCIIIKPAGTLNSYASNALLKLLEEPPPQTLLILIDELCAALAATIISRCQILNFSAPAAATAIAWLQQQQLTGAEPHSEQMWLDILAATYGAPLLALEWQRRGIWQDYQKLVQQLLALSTAKVDPLSLAQEWQHTTLSWLINTCLQQLMRIMRGESQWPASLALAKLVDLASLLQHLLGEISGPYNLNQLLLTEFIFIKWAEYTRPHGREVGQKNRTKI